MARLPVQPAVVVQRRRHLLAGAAVLLAGGRPVLAQPDPASQVQVLPLPAMPASPPRQPLLRAPRLKPGDTIGLFNVSGAIYERLPYQLATEALQALGFKVLEGPHLRTRHGHHAGTPAQRAADFNALVTDPGVQGLVAITGGSGAARVLPLIDYAALRRTPKVVAGFSDVTALLNAVQAQTGLVTFHAPVGVSEWNAFSVAQFKAVLMPERPDSEPHLLRNRSEPGDNLIIKDNRIQTLRPGTARGPLLGGNLAVLSGLAGSAYLPPFDGAILFLEETNEFIYRVDRMLSTLALAGVFNRLAGVVLGAFTNCNPGEGFGTLTLDEVFDEHFGPLNIPVYRGAMIGHIRQKFTVPVGLPAEMDATAGTLRLLMPAVL